MSDTKNVNRHNRRFHILTTILALIVAYLIFVFFRGYILLSMAASSQTGWSDGLFQADPSFGIRLSENVDGYEMLYGRRIPVKTGAYGNRVLAQENRRRMKPEQGRILFIGDSFTFGAAIAAEKTFPELTARATGMTAVNAAVPSYGLAHMVLRTEELLPVIYPDIVVLQYSPWLVDRALSRYMDTQYMGIPQPYIADTSTLSIHGPLGPNRLVGLSQSKLVEGKPSALSHLWFLLRHGMPIIILQDLDALKIFLKDLLGVNPKAADNPLHAVTYAYNRMVKLAESHGAAPIILVMGSNQNLEIPFHSFPQGSYIVDAQHSLILMLPHKTPQAYAQHYWHWVGHPARLIDTHPNEKAHDLIAKTLIMAIEHMENN